MRYLITGGTGFIGRRLCQTLLHQPDEHQLVVLSRQPSNVSSICGASVIGIEHVANLSNDQTFDVIVNLAGAPIASQRWSEERKQVLMHSRIDITNDLVDYIARATTKPALLISGSAIGFYGDEGDQIIDENSTPHEEFSHQLCKDWEASALKAQQHGVRVAILRTGLVLGPEGGVLQKMLPPFKLGLGGRMGSGKQWMSWIHIDDLISMIQFIVDNESESGIFNGTAPEPVTNREFAETLAHELHRPAILPVPSTVLRWAFGEMSDLMLTGQRVVPQHAMNDGFIFQYKKLGQALHNVI